MKFFLGSVLIMWLCMLRKQPEETPPSEKREQQRGGRKEGKEWRMRWQRWKNKSIWRESPEGKQGQREFLNPTWFYYKYRILVSVRRYSTLKWSNINHTDSTQQYTQTHKDIMYWGLLWVRYFGYIVSTVLGYELSTLLGNIASTVLGNWGILC